MFSNKKKVNVQIMQRHSRKKDTLWSLAFSYSTIAYTIISGLLMVPLYLRCIPVELYGAWLATGNIVSWIMMVDSGISSVVLQRIGRSFGADDLKAVGEYAGAGFLIVIGIVLLVILTGIICSFYVARWVNLNDSSFAIELRKNFFIAVVASSVMLLAYLVGAVNQGLLGSFANGFSFLVANAISLISTLILLFLGAGLFSISIGFLVRATIFFGCGLVYMLWRCRRDSILIKFNKICIKEVLGIVSITSFGRIGLLLSKNMNAFLLARFVGTESVPIFVFTSRGLSVAEMFLTRIGNSISPSLSNLLGKKDQHKMRSVIVRLLNLNLWMLGMALGCFLALNDDFVQVWVGREFFAGKWISHLLCALLILMTLVTLMQTLCLALGDIKQNSIVRFVQAFVTIICSFWGVSWFGMLGAALAPLIGVMLISVWYYPWSLGKRASLLKSDWLQLGRETIIVFMLAFFIFWCFSGVTVSGWMMFVLYASCAALLYVLLLTIFSKIARMEFAGLLQQMFFKISSFVKGARVKF